jgi:hypothetical protein
MRLETRTTNVPKMLQHSHLKANSFGWKERVDIGFIALIVLSIFEIIPPQLSSVIQPVGHPDGPSLIISPTIYTLASRLS